VPKIAGPLLGAATLAD